MVWRGVSLVGGWVVSGWVVVVGLWAAESCEFASRVSLGHCLGLIVLFGVPRLGLGHFIFELQCSGPDHWVFMGLSH